jgi:nucleotidyltransferase/DNA polymerase involved in DNA repair
MPSVTAMRLCPDAVWLPGRMSLYASISRALRRIFDDMTPLVEPLSIDEAFLDMTGIARDLGDGARRAADLKERIRQEQRLGASVGVAPNKFLAKLASDMDKPDGLVVLGPDDITTRVWPLPVRRLWGVGPRLGERLDRLGLPTVGDIARRPEAALARDLGERAATHLVRLARGEDDRPVVPVRAPRSISEERTYGVDLRDPARIDRALLARAEGVSRELRRKGLAGRTVHLKVRTGDFTTWTRSVTLPESSDLTETLVAAARRLLAERIRLQGAGVRLLGVGVSGLEHRGERQEELFPAPGARQARRLARATDAIRSRYGEEAVTRARLAGGGRRAEDEDDGEASSLPTVD